MIEREQDVTAAALAVMERTSDPRLRQLGVKDDADFVNPHGGAIALGHPLGMSGARLALTAVHGMEKRGGKLALATMCVGVGQGVTVAIEKLN